ncbi:MAG: sulfite oxidase [Gemmataceae bacterium]
MAEHVPNPSSINHINRRAFLGGMAAATLPLVPGATGGELLGQQSMDQGERLVPALIIRQRNPNNLEFPFSTLNRFLTPNDLFFVRTHFEVPELDAQTWRLKVEGAVEKTIDISFDELKKMPSRTVTALLECAGNSRLYLTSPQLGLRWEQGGVSNAEWTGVPLAEVLHRAGVKDSAVEVVLEGADQGKYEPPEPKTPGIISYARSLPLLKAKQPEVLLAYQMNGQELPAAHGFPVRVVVPGWYGMASVKWLTRIVVTDRPFQGFFQTFTYTYWRRRHGLADLVPVTEAQVKAQIARPAAFETVAANTKYRMFGAAWTGEGTVAKVAVSVDRGKTWTDAQLLDRPVPYAWRFWEFEWRTPAQPGRYTVMARATDDQGRVQPMERDEDRRDTMISHIQPIPVEVRC